MGKVDADITREKDTGYPTSVKPQEVPDSWEDEEEIACIEVFCCYQKAICRAELSVSPGGTTTMSKPQPVFRDLPTGQVLDMTTVDSTLFFQVGSGIYWADQEGKARPRRLEGMPEPAAETTGLQSDGEHLYWVGAHTGSVFQDTRMWRQLGTHVQQFHIGRVSTSGGVWIAAVDMSGSARYLELSQNGGDHVRSATGIAPLPSGTKLLPVPSSASSMTTEQTPQLYAFDKVQKSFVHLRPPPRPLNVPETVDEGPEQQQPSEEQPAGEQRSTENAQTKRPKTRKQRAEERRKALAQFKEKEEVVKQDKNEPPLSWSPGDPEGAGLFSSVDKLFVHRGLGRDRALVQTEEGDILAWDRRLGKVDRVLGNVGGVSLLTAVEQDFDWESPPPALATLTKNDTENPPLPEGCHVS